MLLVWNTCFLFIHHVVLVGVHPPQVAIRKLMNGEVWCRAVGRRPTAETVADRSHTSNSLGESRTINSVDKRTIEAGKKKRTQFSSFLNHCFAVKPVMLSEAHLAVGPDKALRLHSKWQKQQERIKWNFNLRLLFFLPFQQF